MTPNSYKVQKSQWRKWTSDQQEVFNAVYCSMAYNQSIFTHPKAKTVPDEHWTTIAWNAAWTAADAMRGVDAVALRKVA